MKIDIVDNADFKEIIGDVKIALEQNIHEVSIISSFKEKKDINLLILFCNSEEEMSLFSKVKKNMSLVLTYNSNDKFLWHLFSILSPLDIVPINIDLEKLLYRIECNIKLLESE